MTASEVSYLLTIGELSKAGGVRLKDVAEKRNLSGASVCRAVDRLCEKRYIRREENRLVLTEKGEAAVREYEMCVEMIRLEIEARFGCRESVARKDALGVVCAFSEENFEKLLQMSGARSPKER